MKWIEIIELRSNLSQEPQDTIDIQQLIDTTESSPQPYRIVTLKNGVIGTDISFHLLFDTDEVNLHGSKPGKRLADQLRQFGLVNHKIWIETTAVQAKIYSNMVKAAKEGTELRINYETVDKYMAGTQSMEFYIDGGATDTLLNPEILKTMDDLQQQIKTDYPKLVARIHSLANVVKDAYQVLNDDV